MGAGDRVSAAVDTAVAQEAAAGFAGVVRVDVDGETVHASAHGLADRAHGIPCTIDTRFGAASGTKGLTALVALALAERGVLSLGTTARSLLGADLPLIDDAVTVEHLLAHRSGIGDYLDEEQLGDITDHVLPVPVHRLSCPEEYLAVLDGHPMAAAPGERLVYNNGGYVVLALVCERAARTSWFDLVDELVLAPADMERTAFLRHDELPGDVAIGYLHPDGLRTNVLHVPVRGVGDGGAHTCLEDVHRWWTALFDARIVGAATLAAMVTPQGTTRDGDPYGLGLWLDGSTDAVQLEGFDAGISFRSVHQPSRATTWTVIANTSEAAWPLARRLRAILGTSDPPS